MIFVKLIMGNNGKQLENMNAEELLTKGFLPKEFPSLFDSSDLEKSMSIQDSIVNSKPKMSLGIKTSIPKGAGFRRSIMIPNPKHYTVLSKFLESKSEEINRFFEHSEISMSKAVSRAEGSSAIVNEHGFEQVMHKQLLDGFSSKYLLITDISKFYNTIYTHSIPWALHGKQVAKRNRRDNLWGNKLDRFVRNMQDGQTLGIPIGPDASRIVSEIIGVALDRSIQLLEPDLNGIRFIDDFYIYADTAAEAEILAVKINRALSEFELTSNENKSSIQAMPVTIDNLQLQAIRNYKIRKSVPEQKLDIIHIYNLAIDAHKKNPRDNSFHYFLTKVMPIKIHEENWPILESILLQIAHYETKTITIISKIIISYKSFGYDLSLEKIKSAFLRVAKIGIDNNFGYEICWAFWVLSQIGIEVDDVDGLSSISDPLAILSVLTARRKEIYKGNLDMAYWQSLMIPGGLYDSSWMLCYEAERRGWLQNELIKEDPYFNALNDLDVSFLNMESMINPMNEDDLFEETDFEHEIDIFELIYGVGDSYEK